MTTNGKRKPLTERQLLAIISKRITNLDYAINEVYDEVKMTRQMIIDIQEYLEEQERDETDINNL